MRITHLKNDTSALYKDIYIDGKSFQQSLKKWYPSEFSKGRYKEEFMPRIVSKESKQHHHSDHINHNIITPIYGCQDNCCMYVFAEIEYSEAQVKWLRIAQDSAYLGAKDNELEPLVWLQNFKNLVFDKDEYERTFS